MSEGWGCYVSRAVREFRVMTGSDASTDAQLLARMPDPGAVAAFYERHVDSVLRFATRRCAGPDDAADLVSMVFLEVFAAARSFDPERGTARAWLLGIAARCLADARRYGYRSEEIARRLVARPSLDADQFERVEEMIDAARFRPQIERALRKRLTDIEREMFLLVACDGLAPSEAAEVLGLGAVVARMRLSRARAKLRSALAPAGADARAAVMTVHPNGETR